MHCIYQHLTGSISDWYATYNDEVKKHTHTHTHTHTQQTQNQIKKKKILYTSSHCSGVQITGIDSLAIPLLSASFFYFGGKKI